MSINIRPVTGVGEVVPGDDLAHLILTALTPFEDESTAALADGDIVVVTSKAVSKAEGRILRAADREEAITQETVRAVASRRHSDGSGTTRIVENHLGLVMAAAGVDASNTAEGTILLLPQDPDASARKLRVEFMRATRANIGVIIADTAGRPWREGVTDMAIGAAGVTVLDDMRGRADAGGRALSATVVAVADELAAASELVRGKADGIAAAVISGAGKWVMEQDGSGARAIVRPPENDMFRRGSAEAHAEGYAEGYAAGRARRDAQSGE